MAKSNGTRSNGTSGPAGTSSSKARRPVRDVVLVKPTPVECEYDASFRVRVTAYGKPESDSLKLQQVIEDKLQMEFGDRVRVTRIGRAKPPAGP